MFPWIGDGAKLWDLRSLTCAQRFDWPDPSLRLSPGIGWSPCSDLVAFGSDDGAIYVFDRRRIGSYVKKLESARSGAVTDLQFHPGKPVLLAGTQSGDVVAYEY